MFKSTQVSIKKKNKKKKKDQSVNKEASTIFLEM